jgi:2-hydroxychromene-2-carboxylate isomerase
MHQPKQLKHLTFNFDPISPFAYLAFMQLSRALHGLSYSVTYRPVLFAGMLKHFGQLGPAEIAPKRDWTFRHVSYLAHALSIPMTMPPEHPFNPLPFLRLLIASDTSNQGLPNRHACDTILRHIWLEEAHIYSAIKALSPEVCAERLEIPAASINSDRTKALLRAHTDAAISEGCFGVPTIRVDDKNFWGLDALPMLRAYLQGDDAWFERGEWDKAAALPAGVQRPR